MKYKYGFICGALLVSCGLNAAMFSGAEAQKSKVKTPGAPIAARGETANAGPHAAADSETDPRKEVAVLIPKLRSPKTRLAAIEKLIDYGSSELYRSGSIFQLLPKEQSEAANKAATALRPYLHDNVTLISMLNSGNWKLVNLALHNSRIRRGDRWEVNPELIPALKQLGLKGEPSSRREALELLREPIETREWAKTAGAADSDPWVFSSFIKNEPLFNRKVVALLKSPDAKERAKALDFISTNCGSTAQIFWRRFDLRVVNALLSLEKTAQGQERIAVARSLGVVADVDHVRVDPVLARLATDKSPEVSQTAQFWQTAWKGKGRGFGGIEPAAPAAPYNDYKPDAIDAAALKEAEAQR